MEDDSISVYETWKKFTHNEKKNESEFIDLFYQNIMLDLREENGDSVNQEDFDSEIEDHFDKDYSQRPIKTGNSKMDLREYGESDNDGESEIKDHLDKVYGLRPDVNKN